ncbi:M13 family metallopeptidase [Terriglobus saanensis]|uniref:Endothelin-converting enzyme 1 n=1 Tax=Terriglobus saanensis (strain ATCC BAA-1853 / DSM 23119 / SP1PR4) TaxID=401053 RepID=E8UXQ7_TERSS|nr:M13 family metallopeptidase [Terriglobus saanensis]ADV83073.1 Endothelin-converting enzyme 1 [Terriglobus saanensis SP1PR4]
MQLQSMYRAGFSARPRTVPAWIALMAGLSLAAPTVLKAQQIMGPTDLGSKVYKPTPSLDLSSIDNTVDPCSDFYKFACGRYAANHPIPPDDRTVSTFTILRDANNQALRKILEKAASGGPGRSADEQKIGDYYRACMDENTIAKKGLTPLEPLMTQIDRLRSKRDLMTVVGSLQRVGVDVFFVYGEDQDSKHAERQIAVIAQGGLGMPEKDYYLRTGAKDVELRRQYVAHVGRMLILGGSSPERAAKDASGIMAMETALAKASLSVAEMREPENVYHLQPIAVFESKLAGMNFGQLKQAIHSPTITEINNKTPNFIPALVAVVRDTDIQVLKAYMRYHLLHAFATQLPKAFDDENFAFYSRQILGVQEKEPRSKLCTSAVDKGIGEALGKAFVEQYFSADSKAKALQMILDVESAMDRDIDTLEWMSTVTKARAKEKLHLVVNKVGYPEKWRDYSSLVVVADDALGNLERAAAFENDRKLGKIGKPVNRDEWWMTPPTVNAYYEATLNDVGFPAGVLLPPFFDPKQDDAVNYGHIGAAFGHDLSHGFDDKGRKFDGKGNLSNWWTPADEKQFEERTDCLVKEYSAFTVVDDLKVNGKLTLGENTADNSGLVITYLAFLDRAKLSGLDLQIKKDGYTPKQRFYLGFAQDWCENARPEDARQHLLTNAHTPDQYRVNGTIVNQPGFADAFACKKGSPMAPVNSCRVW